MKKLLAMLTLLLVLIAEPLGARVIPRYRTYTVVEVTPKTFVLEDTAGGKVELDRERLPDVKAGEKIFYDKRLKLLWHGERPGK